MRSGKRVEAVKLMPRPQNIQELVSFVGNINYYNKFIEEFSTIAAPFNELSRKNVKFEWTEEQQNAFNQLKEDIVKATKLMHFDD